MHFLATDAGIIASIVRTYCLQTFSLLFKNGNLEPASGKLFYQRRRGRRFRLGKPTSFTLFAALITTPVCFDNPSSQSH